jgi:hypothetical protein
MSSFISFYVVLAIPHCWNSVASSTIGGSGGDGEANVGWGLTKIYTLNELNKSKPIMCMNKNCGLVACSQWVSTEGGKPWNSCLDCQAA